MRATALSRLTLLLLTPLVLALGLAPPVQAASLCGTMTMPPAALRQVSRGFSAYHSGIDLMAPYGSPIRAAAGGTVIYAGWYFAYGKIVDIQHGDGVVTRYAHMEDFAAGIAHGAHVHFEVRLNGHAVDPKPYLGLAACPAVPLSEPIESAAAPPH
jgi:murein DD-endopeptidase MepM/ murein hydrolase activator NlpD